MDAYRINRMIGIVFMAAGLAMLGAGGHWALRGYGLQVRGQQTTGRIVNIHYDNGVNPNSVFQNAPSHRADIVFTDKAGHQFTITDTVGRTQSSYAVGNPIALRYPADDPQKAVIERKGAVWLVPGVFAFFGFFLVLGGLQRTRMQPGELMPSRSGPPLDR